MNLTKKEILLRMAVELGVCDYPNTADNAPVLPADPATLARLEKAYEDGREALYHEDPTLNCLRPNRRITLDPTGAACVNGEADRYAMPESVEAPPLGKMVFYYPDSGGVGGYVQVTSWQRLNALRASRAGGATNTGKPTLVAFWPMGQLKGDSASRWEMRIDPAPDKAYILEAPFKTQCVPQSDWDEIEPIGYPLAVLAYGVYEVQRVNPMGTGPTQEQALSNRNEWLRRIITNERSQNPRTLGRSGAALPSRARMARNSYRQVEYTPVSVTLQDGSVLGPGTL